MLQRCLVKLGAWAKLSATQKKYGPNPSPKKAGLQVHEAEDWDGKTCKWVFVPKLGPDMLAAEMVDRHKLADDRVVDDGSSVRADQRANETWQEYSDSMINLNPTSNRGTHKLKDGSEVRLPAMTAGDLFGDLGGGLGGGSIVGAPSCAASSVCGDLYDYKKDMNYE